MSINPARSSKFWLYAFGYFILLAALVFFYFYDWPEPEPEIVQQVTPVPQEEPETPAYCAGDKSGSLEGVLALMPEKLLFNQLLENDESCAAEICASLEGGNKLKPEFESASTGPCLSLTTEIAVDYHNEKLRDLPLISFFFDAGKSNLMTSQQSGLRAFLRAFKKSPQDYGVVIVGRASSSGSSVANYKLSENRALSIQNLVKAELPGLAYSDFIYFGDRPPVLTQSLASSYGISKREYEFIRYGAGGDDDFSKRLNQSAILVVYPVDKDPFGIVEAQSF